MNLEIVITGIPEIERRLDEVAARARQAAARALFEEGEAIIGDAKEHYVPVDLSTLKNSGHVQLPEVNGDEITVRMGFGGAAAPYALAVHEHLSEHSPASWRKAVASGRGVKFSPAGHGPRFLERPFVAAAAGMAARIAAKMREAIR